MASMLRLPFTFHPPPPPPPLTILCSLHSNNNAHPNTITNPQFIHNSFETRPSDGLHHPAGSSASPLFWPPHEAAEVSDARDYVRVANPALRFANIMWFNRPVNAHITVAPDESPDSIVRRFRKAVSQAGVIQECRRRRFFETPQDKIKRKRQALRRRKPRFKGLSFNTDPFAPKDASMSGSNNDDDDDNWDYEPNL